MGDWHGWRPDFTFTHCCILFQTLLVLSIGFYKLFWIRNATPPVPPPPLMLWCLYFICLGIEEAQASSNVTWSCQSHGSAVMSGQTSRICVCHYHWPNGVQSALLLQSDPAGSLAPGHNHHPVTRYRRKGCQAHCTPEMEDTLLRTLLEIREGIGSGFRWKRENIVSIPWQRTSDAGVPALPWSPSQWPHGWQACRNADRFRWGQHQRSHVWS